ncbi:MAG TPA: hypothetical protein VFO86_10230 [Terriglobia bacterium]|nr:hypothetical protein [Terriglobia bacterium]
MSILETAADVTPVISWKRVIAGGLLSEVAVIAVLSVIVAIYAFVIRPGRPAADYQEIGRLAGYYAALPAAAFATFLMANWAVRTLESGLFVNAFLVGVVATLFAAMFLFTAKPEDRPMYIASFAARLIAGGLAGFIAQRMRGA